MPALHYSHFLPFIQDHATGEAITQTTEGAAARAAVPLLEDEQPRLTPAEAQAAEYKRLFSKAVDLGLSLTKDGQPLPPAIPPTSAKLSMAVDYLRGLITQAESMADVPDAVAA